MAGAKGEGGREGGKGGTLLDFFCFSRVLHSCAVDVHLSSLSINCVVLGARMR